MTTRTRKGPEWIKDHAGRYVSKRSGWIIERSENSADWNVINPDTDGVFDTHKSLTEAKKWYSGIQGVRLRQNANPVPSVKAVGNETVYLRISLIPAGVQTRRSYWVIKCGQKGKTVIYRKCLRNGDPLNEYILAEAQEVTEKPAVMNRKYAELEVTQTQCNRV